MAQGTRSCSEKRFLCKTLQSAHAGSALLLERGGEMMAEQNEMYRVNGFLNYSGVYI